MTVTGINFTGTSGNDTINGDSGNDSLYGAGGNDIINGKAGNDKLYGQNGDDTLAGNEGNDSLYGGAGNDTYLFNSGDGQDTLSDTVGTDSIVFGSSIEPGDLTFTKVGNHLAITFADNNTDKLTIENWFYSAAYRIKNFKFDDSTVLTTDDIGSAHYPYMGTAGNDNWTGTAADEKFSALGGNDTLNGANGNDTLEGGDDNDKLYGSNGDDTLAGNEGSDSLYGGAGNDTYVFNSGDGQDTLSDTVGTDSIVFGSSIEPEDLTFTKFGNHLAITFADNNTDKLTIENWFYSAAYRIKNFKFDDSTVLTTDDIGSAHYPYMGTAGNDNWTGTAADEKFSALIGNDILNGANGNDILEGGAGNDKLYGSNGNDTLAGNEGNDSLYGGADNDTYLFNSGDGQDTLSDNVGTDSIVFGSSIKAEDLTFTKVGNHLAITFADNNTDKLTIENWFYSAAYRIKNLKFADASVINDSVIGTVDYPIFGTSGNDTWNGSTSDELFFGLGGNDSLYGSNGNDTLDGDAGNDRLYGQYDNDSLIGDLGNDSLYGDVGDDTLIGGIGNDNSEGGAGNDSYFYNAGDGKDIILDSAGIDSITFGSTIEVEDLTFTKVGNNLALTFADNITDKLTISSWFYNNNYKIEKFNFSDSSVLTISDIGTADYPIFGTSGNDTWNGTSSNERFFALGGHDSLYGSNGNDTLDGGSGNDRLYGQNDHDSIIGAEGNDSLYGAAGNDTLIGGTENDYLDGATGNDSYFYNAGDGQDIITDSKGIDIITFGNTIEAEDLTFTKVGNNLAVTFADNITDKLTIQSWFYRADYKIENFKFSDSTVLTISDLGTADYPFYGTAGNDYWYGITKNEKFFGLEGNDSLYGYTGNDTLDGDAGNDRLYGQDNNDSIMGDAGKDSLYGGNGDDTLIGGTENDYLSGDAGNDSYFYDAGDGYDTIIDSDGTDSITFGSTIKPEDITFSKSGYDLNITFANSNTDKLTIQSWFYRTKYKIENFKFSDSTVLTIDDVGTANYPFYGTAGNDYWYGIAKNEKFFGLDGKDSLYGYDGNDTIAGNAGNDYLYGQNNNDSLIGDEGQDSIYGGNGDDTLIGGIGNDYLSGDAGNDSYFFNAGDGKDIILDSAGIDSVTFGNSLKAEDITFTKSGYDLNITFANNNTDKLTIQSWFYNSKYIIEKFNFSDSAVLTQNDVGTAVYPLFGTTANDYWYGTNNDEKFFGLEGKDSLYGANGNDTIDGGPGNDIIYAHNNDDSLIGGIGADSLYGETGNDTYFFNLGDGQDVIADSSGEDTIMFGGSIAEEDVIFTKVGNNMEITFANNNIDKITVQNHHYPTGTYKIENFVYTQGLDVIEGSDGNDTLKGTDADEHLIGKDGNDSLYGKGGNDSLSGGNGNDKLDGGNGADTLNGGAGKDRYMIDNTGDVIIDSAGYDFVTSSVDYTLSEGTEVLQLTNNATTGTGNGLDNNIVGNSLNNILNGGDGNDRIYAKKGNDSLTGGNGNDYLSGGSGVDTMNGGAGNDRFVVDNINDVIIDSAGYDGVYSYIDYTLSDHIEKLCLRGDAIIAEGNDSDNWIEGNAQSNTLQGNKGNDYLAGNKGDDTYIFNAGDGKDRILDYGLNTDDTVQFGAGIETENIAFFDRGGYYLDIKYGDGDVVSIQQYNHPKYSVENIEVKSGLSADINGIINHIATYQATNDLDFTGVNDVSDDARLMQELQVYWV